MSDATTQNISELYNSISTPLTHILTGTQVLLPLLNALPDREKQNINAAISAQKRTGQEAFVAPDTLAALPGLQRSMQAFDSFCQKTLTSTPLTSAEIAAGSLAYEPFNQFTQSIAALDNALGEHPEIQQKAHAICENCATIINQIGDPNHGRAFLDSIDILTNTPSSQDDSRSFQAVTQKTLELLQRLHALPEEEKNRIVALKPAYEAQCTLPGDKGVWNVHIADALDTVTKLSPPFTAKTPVENLETARNTINQLRIPVRALNALLLATNTPDGKNDDLLALSSQITSHCWAMQCSINKLINKSRPPTNITGATGEAISPEEKGASLA